MSDNVNHPSHYLAHPSGVECITITETMNFCVGNAVKYLWRAGLKSDDPREDLLKARWYVDRELERLGHVDAAEVIAAPVEAPVARVFNVGDPEPADKKSISLTGYSALFDEDVELRWGSYGKANRDFSWRAGWWNVRPVDDPVWESWNVWLEYYGPLTEVL